MSRIWVHYEKWEDWKNGLYASNKQDELVERVKSFLSNSSLFFEISMQMLNQWPNSSLHNMSFKKSNRRSYIGQAASCFYLGANVKTTCKAWELISKEDRDMANKIADEVVEYFDKEIYPKYSMEVLNEEIS